MTILSKWRIPAGVCVLTTGLLMAATGVAVADTDAGSSGSPSGSDGSSTSSQQTSTGETDSEGQSGSGDADAVADDSAGQPGQWNSTNETDAEEASGSGDAEDVAGDSAGQSDPQGSTAETDSEQQSGSTDTDLGGVDPGPVAEVPEEAVTVPEEAVTVPEEAETFPDVAAAVPDPVAEVPSEAVAVPEVVAAPVPDVAAAAVDTVAAALDVMAVSVPDAVAPAPLDVAAPAPDVAALVSEVSALVPNVLPTTVGPDIPLTQLQSDFYQFLLGFVGMGPASVFSGLLQHMLTAVAGAVVLLMQLPADLYYFLLGFAGSQAITGGGGAELSPATKAWVVSHWELILELAGIPDGSRAFKALTEGVTHGAPAVSTFSAMKHGRAQLPTSVTSPPPAVVRPESALSLLRYTADAFLAPISLLALAAIALPGIAGLLLLCAAGTRFGYRQAAAALAVRSTGIARFSHEGPLGVVRSGSLVEVRPRELRRSRGDKEIGTAITTATLGSRQKFRPCAHARAG
ncbi:hypothetical protein [Mycolicibacterium sp. CR10]|uniref:hypothetical protein n=1 Tax=Mycolicibacterium sp. CR10 TaxID=2562314 RepID=UPI0010C0AE33|nr:hypothetical protein [Mycolicibacterium sp. CR10]